MITETEASHAWKTRRVAINTVDPGHMSAAVNKQYDFANVPDEPYLGQRWDGSAGYFVPASAISNFIPAHLRF